MAARLNRRCSDQIRDKIQAVQLINRLEKCAFGEIELTQTQIQAIKILLDKAVSNAPTDVNMAGDVTITWPEPKNALDE